MKRASQRATKIFLDGGDPQETREMKTLLGFLDGQTTNPTLFAKNPAVRARRERGETFTRKEIMEWYRAVAQEISREIPGGSVSIEVYADARTEARDMIREAQEMYTWIPNARIKFPISRAGLSAAEAVAREGMRVNMTLCFSQQQAAAVYAATRGAEKGQVFVSPFIGRLDDRGQNGMDMIANIMRMYKQGDSHVQVLSASIRAMDHFFSALQIGSDIITAPAKILREWASTGCKMPSANWSYHPAGLTPIPYEEINMAKDWQAFDIAHELTDQGMARFSEDWNALIRAA